MRKTWIIACAAAAVALAGCNRETQGPVAVGNVFRASIPPWRHSTATWPG